jgi:uncharacterized protein (DUF2141 family)
MRSILVFVISICIQFAPGIYAQTSTETILEIKVTGIQTSKGMIAVGINDSPEGWPRKPQYEYEWNKEGLQDSILVVKVSGLKYGCYAISAIDDENSNEELDLLKRESFGFSGNPVVKFSPPKFEECSFPIENEITQVEIHMKKRGE